MALPAPRDLPVVEARFDEMRRQWLVKLPGGLTLPAADEMDVEALCRRYAPYAALRFVRTPTAAGDIQPAEAG